MQIFPFLRCWQKLVIGFVVWGTGYLNGCGSSRGVLAWMASSCSLLVVLFFVCAVSRSVPGCFVFLGFLWCGLGFSFFVSGLKGFAHPPRCNETESWNSPFIPAVESRRLQGANPRQSGDLCWADISDFSRWLGRR